MSFVEQDDVFEVVEELMVKLFKNFSKKEILGKEFQEYHLMKQCLNMELTNRFKKSINNFRYNINFQRDDVKFDIFKKLVKGVYSKVYSNKKHKDKPRSFLIILINGQKNRVHRA